MSIRKIADYSPPCLHPEHNPPSHMVYEPGLYEHICPGCGKRIVFSVNGVYWQTIPSYTPSPFYDYDYSYSYDYSYDSCIPLSDTRNWIVPDLTKGPSHA